MQKRKEGIVRYWLAAIVVGLLTAAASSSARAQGPVGEWRVADGKAHIRIVDCSGALWGVVSWEKRPGGRDTNNPHPALRRRPTLGMPVLLHMKPGDERGRWEGEVYNADDGNTYDASIALHGPDTLHVEGCALGFLCGGENWSRLSGRAATTGAAHSPALLPAGAVCARIGAAAGRSH